MIYDLVYLLLIISIIECTAWFFLKKNYLTNNKTYLLLYLMLYMIIPFFLIKTLKYEGIGVVNMLWNIISTIVVILIGYYVFSERINHLQYLGIGLGFLSIILICNNKE